MTTTPPPALDCHTPATDGPHAAPQPVDSGAVGAPKGVAEGVLSALRPDPQVGDGRHPVAWLHVVAPPDWRIVPTATSRCACGRDRSVIGRKNVLALVQDHTAHRDVCPLRNSEGRKAA